MSSSSSSQRSIDTAYRAYHRLGMGWQLAIFLLIALSITWAIVIVELGRLRDMAERESKLEISNLAHAFAEEVNSSVNTIDLSLLGFRSHWLKDRAGFRDIVQQMQHHLEGNISFHVAIVDAAGRVVFSSIDPSVKPLDVSDREHIRVHRDSQADRLFISKPVLGRISQQWLIQFTRPLYAPNGKFDGVVVLSVTPGYFSRFYQQIRLGPDAVITLVRDGGTVISRSSLQEQGRGIGQVLTGEQFRNTATLSTGFYRRASQVDGIERLYAWRTLPRYGLVVMVGQSIDPIIKRYRQEQQAYVVGGIGISVLLAVIGYLLLSASRRQARDAEILAESEARWKFAVEGSGDGIWDWDLAQASVRLSPRSREILQVEEEDLPGTQEEIIRMIHPADVATVRAVLEAHLDGQTEAYQIEHRLPDTSGPGRWVMARGMVVKRSKEGQPLRMVGTYTDISERKVKEARTDHLAQHDALTDLPNRTLLADRLRQALLRAKREKTELAVLFFDLDKFKPVNDTYGHWIGDLLLIAVASRVRGLLRESDTLARIGGDEFVVLLPHIRTAEDAMIVANNILASLNQAFEIEGHTLHISGSVGVATYPKDSEEEAELMRCADRAMYQAKEAGRNRVHAYQAAPAS